MRKRTIISKWVQFNFEKHSSFSHVFGRPAESLFWKENSMGNKRNYFISMQKRVKYCAVVIVDGKISEASLSLAPNGIRIKYLKSFTRTHARIHAVVNFSFYYDDFSQLNWTNLSIYWLCHRVAMASLVFIILQCQFGVFF